MNFAGKRSVLRKTRTESPSQVIKSAIQLGALSLKLGNEIGRLGEDGCGVEVVVEEGECGVGEMRRWWQWLEAVHR